MPSIVSAKSDGVRIDRSRPDFLQPGERLRPTQDHLLIRPMEWDASSTLVAIRQGYPVRGEVLAVGPGKYRREYSPDRKKTWLSDVFIPTQVKVGDVVELGGLEIGGYMFQQIIIDGSVHLLVSERDVAIVRDDLRSASQ